MGSKKCFMKLETLCFFGASVFTLDVLVRLWELVFEVLLICLTWSKYGHKGVQTRVISSFFSTVYCTFSLILAYFMFRGLEQKSSGIIKLASVFVLVLRLWECGAQIFSWWHIPEPYNDEFGIGRASHIGKFIVVNVFSAVFVILLVLYYRKLLPGRKSKKSSSRHSQTSCSAIYSP
ncbi:unnamed protein product [Orchesella dallaii]|uniref:Transmembrane protein n=1 Tax=Orchesella dallaii TaxID=48710 RepID=A0ABP1PRF0_9HEXA